MEMTKHPWKSMSNHIDPEKEEQLKSAKIELENQVKKAIKIAKNLNHGNKERTLRNKSEVISIVEDFEKQYKSLYALYEDLKEQVKKNVNGGDVDNNISSSASNSDSESFYSPGGSYATKSTQISSTSKDSDSNSENDQTSDLEDTILKDKLTSCSSEVKIITNFSSSSGSVESLKDFRVHGASESETVAMKTAQINDLERQVESLRLENSTLCAEKGELKEQMECKSDEAKQMKETILRLEAQVLEIDVELKEKERRFYSVKQMEDTEQKYISQVSELVAKGNDMQVELDALRNQNGDLEKSASRVKGLIEQIDSLKNELDNVNSQKTELKSEIEKKSKETSKYMTQIESLKNELSSNEKCLSKDSVKAQANDLESKISSLLVAKTELEEQVKELNHEASQSNGKISELRKALSDKENELKKSSTKTKSLDEEVENLKSKLEIIENEKTRFQKEIETLRNDKNRLETELAKKKDESFLSKSQMEQFSKSSFQVVEKKVEEMLEEFRKKLEDQYRILSRRIRVAEQLQVENKEWYRKTKEAYEQQNMDLKMRAERNEIELKNVKDMTLAANKFLISLDSVALNFQELSANFLNRISKASCELKFVTHWAMRKNKANLHVKEEMDCLFGQLEEKEVEIMGLREKVWKSDNKVRELEKMAKDNDDAMMGLKEEKREAIRQLCVWIDYHRGRSDYYLKMLSDKNLVRRRAT